MEIEKFRLHHITKHNHEEATRVQREARHVLHAQWKEYFDPNLEPEYDLEVQLKADWAEWNWSLLYRLVCPAGLDPTDIPLFYKHDDQEFETVMR